MKQVPSIKERNIALIGFMGVGKTSVGEQLAKKLYRDFIDIDQEIEKEAQMKISDIFRTKGESAFREMEKEMSIRFCKDTSLKVLSLGGGAYMQEEIREACLAHCIVIYLDLSWAKWKERLNILIDNRPVLQEKNVNEMEELFNKRSPSYQLNSFSVNTEGQDPDEVATYIEDVIKLGWELYDR